MSNYSVVSQLLLFYYISELFKPPEEIFVTSFAADCTILTSGNGIDDMCLKADAYINDLSRFSRYEELDNLPCRIYSNHIHKLDDWSSD